MYNQANKLSLNTLNSEENDVQIKFATTTDEKEAIYRFRYNVFIEEMASPVQHAADHYNKKMFDELDQFSTLIYAVSGSKIVGTARITIGTYDQFPKWLSETFNFIKFTNLLYDYPNKNIGLSTKMAVSHSHRGSTTMYQLISKIFRIYIDNRIEISFGGGNPRLIKLYERVGYRRFTKNFTEPGYGLLIPLVLIHGDIDHFKAVRSPLYRVVPKSSTTALSERFYEAFPESTKHINSQLNNLSWIYFNDRLRKEIHLSPLNKLNEHELNTLVQLGALFHCSKGDIITTAGEMSNELYFLLSGSLNIITSNGSSLLRPGQCFGNGTSSAQAYTAKITAITPSEILIITRIAFEKFNHLYPSISRKILSSSLL